MSILTTIINSLFFQLLIKLSDTKVKNTYLSIIGIKK